MFTVRNAEVSKSHTLMITIYVPIYRTLMQAISNLPNLNSLKTGHHKPPRLHRRFRSSPISSILSIAGILLLDMRWSEQICKIAARMARAPFGLHHPPNFTFDHAYKKYELDKIITTEISISPPWLIAMNINLELHQFPK